MRKVLSGKGIARHAFNAVATKSHNSKNKKHIQWPISYIYNSIFTLEKRAGVDWEFRKFDATETDEVENQKAK